MLKALVIKDDRRRFRDLGDILAVARAEGQKLFGTHEKVNVVEVINSINGYYVVVVGFPEELYEAAGVSGSLRKIS